MSDSLFFRVVLHLTRIACCALILKLPALLLAWMLPVDRLRVLLEHHICSQLAAADGLGDGGRALRIGTPWSWPSHVQRGVSEHLHVEQMLMANGGLIV